jgi:hypothetical protein
VLSKRTVPLALDSRTVTGSREPGVKCKALSSAGRASAKASSALSTPTTIFAWKVRRRAGRPEFCWFSRCTSTIALASCRKCSRSASGEPPW